MELWIRSQSRKSLIKVEKIEMVDANNIKKLLYINKYDEIEKEQTTNNDFEIVSDYNSLGIYKTEERALEVLNEIQKIIQNNVIEMQTYGNPEREWRYYYNTSIVYEMPKE